MTTTDVRAAREAAVAELPPGLRDHVLRVVVEACRLADESLESAMRVLLDHHVSKALERGWALHPDTVGARNELVVQE